MLGFLRKHQRYFFFVITFMTIVSFSFFGTYGTISANSVREQPAFTAIDGTVVPRSELEEMSHFIATDEDDKRLYGGAWGPNFLNDGVIRKEFLSTGLGEVLINAYIDDLKGDLDIRLRKEKHYNSYIHPNAKFLSAQAAWAYFAPEIISNLGILKGLDNPADPKVITAKIALYNAQQKFPEPALRQVLAYQEQQYGWLPHDPTLDRSDFSLFNYHSLDDWFGPRFTKLVAQFVINAAKVAENRGYVVTKDEAMADLLYRSQKSFKEFSNSAQLGVHNSSDYFREQLRLLGMDQNQAVKVWRQVLLFRRLFQDLGNSVWIDPIAYQNFDKYALEGIDGDHYHLPVEFRFGDYGSLQKFETYLSAVAKRSNNDADLLALPTTFLSADDVAKKNPELVQKKYVLEIASADKKVLEAKVGVKEMWNWQIDNWNKLRKQFPELGTKTADSRDERLALLESLDNATHGRVDQFSRSAIVDAHPEWIQEALDQAPFNKSEVGLRIKGGKFPFRGVDNRTEFFSQLDQAPLGSDPIEFTGDKKTYYRIRVLERQPQLDILTFAEAKSDGTLDEMLNNQLDTFYVKVRSESPEKYQRTEGTWRPIAEVKDQVADQYFAPLLKAIKADAKKGDTLTGDVTASLRFNKMVRSAQQAIAKDPTQASKWIQPESPKIADQWKLVKEDVKVTRGTPQEQMNVAAIFKLNEGEWLPVQTPPNGDVYFFYTKQRMHEADPAVVAEQISKARQILSDDAQQVLMQKLLVDFREKNAISFDYLNVAQTQIEPENVEQ